MMSFSLSEDKVVQVPCKASASYLYNNLSFSGSHFAFVHQNEVHVTLDTTTVKKGSTNIKIVAKENSQVSQVKWVHSKKGSPNSQKNNLVITTQSHFQIYDQDCSKAIFTYSLQPATIETTPSKSKFSRGIATVQIQNKTYLLIGTSKGLILVFEYIQGKSKECCTLSQTLTLHTSPICDIAADSSSPIWASSDANGTVILWNEFTSVATIPGVGFPCAALAINKQHLICGYGNGVVSVYDASTGTRTADIAAHSRFIHAIDLHPSLNVFATVADDAKLKVWQISTETNEVSSLSMQPVKDSLLCGVQFCGEGFTHVAVVSYDSSVVHVFTH